MVLDNLLYTKEHEWVKVDGEIGIIGITDYAQGELGDIVMLELPKIGLKAMQLKSIGTIEAVKAVSDIYSPLTGDIVEINNEVMNNPAIINQDPYGKGWLVKIKIDNKDELKILMKADEYKKLIGEM